MREWLSGGAPPCQGGGRGFDPRLALEKITGHPIGCPVIFSSPILDSKVRCLRSAPVRAIRGPPDLVRRLALFRGWSGLEGSMSTLRFGPRNPRSPGPRAPSRALLDFFYFVPVYFFIFKIVFPVMFIHFTHDPAGISHGNYV